jgi:hypothetical protein
MFSDVTSIKNFIEPGTAKSSSPWAHFYHSNAKSLALALQHELTSGGC